MNRLRSEPAGFNIDEASSAEFLEPRDGFFRELDGEASPGGSADASGTCRTHQADGSAASAVMQAPRIVLQDSSEADNPILRETQPDRSGNSGAQPETTA
jgi:hypothetical protein